jgi:hypothetical protein
LQAEQIRRHDLPALVARERCDEFELQAQRRRAGRHVDVKREHLLGIATPRDTLAARRAHLQAREHLDRSRARVVARQPAWIQQRHRPARRDGNRLHDPHDAPIHVTRVHLQRQRTRIVDVRRGGNVAVPAQCGGYDPRRGQEGEQ